MRRICGSLRFDKVYFRFSRYVGDLDDRTFADGVAYRARVKATHAVYRFVGDFVRVAVQRDGAAEFCGAAGEGGTVAANSYRVPVTAEHAQSAYFLSARFGQVREDVVIALDGEYVRIYVWADGVYIAHSVTEVNEKIEIADGGQRVEQFFSAAVSVRKYDSPHFSSSFP